MSEEEVSHCKSKYLCNPARSGYYSRVLDSNLYSSSLPLLRGRFRGGGGLGKAVEVRRTTATTRTKPKTKKKIQILNLNLRFRMRYLLFTLYIIIHLRTNNVNFFDFIIKCNYKSYNMIY